MLNKYIGFAILPLFAVIFIDSLGWGIVYPIFEPIILGNVTKIFSGFTSLTMRNFWYEAMVGIYCLCLFIMSPLLGSLSDKYGRKLILLISLMGCAVGFTVSGSGIAYNSFTLLILGRIVSGSTAGAMPIAQAAMMDISSYGEKTKYLSLSILANVSGFALGPILGAFLLNRSIWKTHTDYLTPFWVASAIAILGFILLYKLFEDTFVGTRGQAVKIWTGFFNIYDVVCKKNTRYLVIVFTTFMLAWVMFFSAEPLLLAEHFGWDASSIGNFIGFTATCLGIGIILVMPHLMKRINLSKIILYSLIAMFCCSSIFPFINRTILFWPLAVSNMAIPFVYIGLATIFSNTVTVHEQGKIMGILGSLLALTWGIGPILVGYISKNGINCSYAVSSGLFLLAAVFFIFQKNRGEA